MFFRSSWQGLAYMMSVLLYRARAGTGVVLLFYLGPYLLFLFIYLFSLFGGGCPWHMEVPRLKFKSELQLQATVTATWDLSHICNVHHSSQQCWILFLFFLVFFGPHPRHVEVPSLGSNWSYSCWPAPQPQQCQI